jgi:hypothetical protein
MSRRPVVFPGENVNEGEGDFGQTRGTDPTIKPGTSLDYVHRYIYTYPTWLIRDYNLNENFSALFSETTSPIQDYFSF